MNEPEADVYRRARGAPTPTRFADHAPPGWSYSDRTTKGRGAREDAAGGPPAAEPEPLPADTGGGVMEPEKTAGPAPKPYKAVAALLVLLGNALGTYLETGGFDTEEVRQVVEAVVAAALVYIVDNGR